MSAETRKGILRQGAIVLQCGIVFISYFGIVGFLLYAPLSAAGLV